MVGHAELSLRPALAGQVLVWFKGPAWRPGDLPPKSAPIGAKPNTTPRFGFAKGYTFVQFWVITYASMTLQPNI